MKTTTRKSVVRRFLKNNYEMISGILLVYTLFVIIGIATSIIDMDSTLLPIHIPMIISAVITGLLGAGLVWIYRE